MNSEEFHLIFHSGATEGVNTLVRGFFNSQSQQERKAHFYYSSVDHACVYKQVDFLKAQGVGSTELKVNEQGELEDTPSIKDQDSTNLLNFTWVNNETGVVWPLAKARDLKKRLNCLVHVDAAQAIGKIEDFRKLDPELDAYTFSGHKFGAFKGVGFSFIKKGFPFTPLLVGGSHQQGMRAGTENPMALWSMKLALEDIMSVDLVKLQQAKKSLEKGLKKQFGDRLTIVGEGAAERNANTSFCVINQCKIESVLINLDLNKVYLSTGSACSSGLIKPSHVLKALGMSDELAKSGLRISLPFDADSQLVDEVLPLIIQSIPKI